MLLYLFLSALVVVIVANTEETLSCKAALCVLVFLLPLLLMVGAVVGALILALIGVKAASN